MSATQRLLDGRSAEFVDSRNLGSLMGATQRLLTGRSAQFVDGGPGKTMISILPSGQDTDMEIDLISQYNDGTHFWNVFYFSPVVRHVVNYWLLTVNGG